MLEHRKVLAHPFATSPAACRLLCFGAPSAQDDNPEFNLRALHMRLLIEDGMNLTHWEAFVRHFEDTIYSLHEIPAQQQQSAIAWLHSTHHAFRPAEPLEVEVFKAQKSGRAPGKCPFH